MQPGGRIIIPRLMERDWASAQRMKIPFLVHWQRTRRDDDAGKRESVKIFLACLSQVSAVALQLSNPFSTLAPHFVGALWESRIRARFPQLIPHGRLMKLLHILWNRICEYVIAIKLCHGGGGQGEGSGGFVI